MKQPTNSNCSGLTKRVWDFADLVIKNRFARALEEGAARYPIFRELRFAARIELEVLLDAIALDPAWRAERINADARTHRTLSQVSVRGLAKVRMGVVWVALAINVMRTMEIVPHLMT